MIIFFGPDGSGKSTLARKLREVLLGRGFRVKVCWMRGTHTLASLLARILVRFKVFSGSDNPYYGMTVPLSFRRIWQLVEFTSVLPIVLFRFILPRILGFWVVADRYVPDFIVWVSLITVDRDYLKSFEAKFLLALAFKTYAKVYVTANLEELSKRSGASLNFLGDQLKLYDRIASAVSVYKLDTTAKRVDESLMELLNILEAHGVR
jgi:thymidylate kinase